MTARKLVAEALGTGLLVTAVVGSGIMAEDTEDFARIHRQFLSRLPGVRQMQSSFALRTVVKTTALAV